MSIRLVEAGEFMARRNGSVDPSKFPDEEFELHSIPAFDAGKPAILRGSEIGSAKQVIQPNDVMISKIVPHIRRSSVVVPATGRRQIASSEWIVFRSEDLFPHYLRHLLISDKFNAKFMSTVSGVGGSLLRARPAQVAKIKIPVPPLAEQRRIAAILDKADALRTKRREAIAKLDQLLQSVFLDMFGDEADSRFPVVPLAEAFWFQEGPGVRKWQFTDTGVKLLNVGNIEKDGTIDLTKTDRHVSLEEAHGKYRHFLVDAGDLVIASSGISFDVDGFLRTRGAFVSETHLPLCMNTSTIRFKSLEGKSSLRFLQAWISSTGFRKQITRLVTGSAQQNFGPSHLRKLSIPLPPLKEQEGFGRMADRIEKERQAAQRQGGRFDSLFASLQHRAFAGTL